jgi:hypothetical protein
MTAPATRSAPDHDSGNQSPSIGWRGPRPRASRCMVKPLDDRRQPLRRSKELGDGVLHRTIIRVQKMYFDPPDLDGRMPRVSKWER